MTHKHSRYLAVLVLLALALVALPAAAGREGFGRNRKVLELTRINPPQVLIRGERVSVEVTASDRDNHEIAERFRAQLASKLVGGDSRLRLDSDRPETLIKVEVLQDEFRAYNEHRKGTERQRVGKDSKGKPIYKERSVTITYMHLSHLLRFAYTVTEARDGATIIADSSEIDFADVIREGDPLPSQPAIEGDSLDRAVAEIVHQLTPTSEPIQVLLPKGSLADQIAFAEAGLWNRYSETLETMSPLPSSAEDSYRQYGIGLAYEALGYSADSPETTLRYLEKAAEQYNLALNANPREKYFSQPFEGSVLGVMGRKTLAAFRDVLNGRDEPTTLAAQQRPSIPPPIRRVETSLAKYRALLDQSKQLLAAPAAGAKSLPSGQVAEDDVTNELVIEMLAAELDEEIIKTAIADSSGCALDRSPMGLIQLKKADVPDTIISQIQSLECSP